MAEGRPTMDEATREALACSAKAEANRLGLVGDAFWSFVWSEVETAMRESGMLPAGWTWAKSRASAPATPAAYTSASQ
jgi:hypothetical protein